jgi:hypothetical protein
VSAWQYYKISVMVWYSVVVVRIQKEVVYGHGFKADMHLGNETCTVCRTLCNKPHPLRDLMLTVTESIELPLDLPSQARR